MSLLSPLLMLVYFLGKNYAQGECGWGGFSYGRYPFDANYSDHCESYPTLHVGCGVILGGNVWNYCVNGSCQISKSTFQTFGTVASFSNSVLPGGMGFVVDLYGPDLQTLADTVDSCGFPRPALSPSLTEISSKPKPRSRELFRPLRQQKQQLLQQQQRPVADVGGFGRTESEESGYAGFVYALPNNTDPNSVLSWCAVSVGKKVVTAEAWFCVQDVQVGFKKCSIDDHGSALSVKVTPTPQLLSWNFRPSLPPASDRLVIYSVRFANVTCSVGKACDTVVAIGLSNVIRENCKFA